MIQLITRSEDKKLEQMTFESESVLFHLDINTETLLNCIVVAGFLLLITLCHRLTRQRTPCRLKPPLSWRHYSPAPPSHPTLPPFLSGVGGQGDPVYQRPCEQSKGRPSHSQFLPTPTPPPPAGCVCVGGVGFGGGGGGYTPSPLSQAPHSAS